MTITPASSQKTYKKKTIMIKNLALIAALALGSSSFFFASADKMEKKGKKKKGDKRDKMEKMEKPA